jgi:hypothetical protein
VIDCVFVNGDSYSVPGGLITKVYGHWLAEHFNVPLVNLAVEGSNNDRILRSSIEWLSTTKYKNPLVVVGWSFLRRIEVCYYGKNPAMVARIPDQEFSNTRMITLDYLLNANQATLEQQALVVDIDTLDKLLIDFYTNLYLFSQLLKLKNINYFFYSAANNTDSEVTCYPGISSLQIVQDVIDNPRIYQLHNHCTMNWALDNDPECSKDTGHLSLTGHRLWAEKLLTLIKL